MHSQIMGLRVAGILFGLMFLGQLIRLAIQPDVIVAGHTVPLWPSMIAVVIFGGLSVWMWTLTRHTTR